MHLQKQGYRLQRFLRLRRVTKDAVSINALRIHSSNLGDGTWCHKWVQPKSISLWCHTIACHARGISFSPMKWRRNCFSIVVHTKSTAKNAVSCSVRIFSAIWWPYYILQAKMNRISQFRIRKMFMKCGNFSQRVRRFILWFWQKSPIAYCPRPLPRRHRIIFSLKCTVVVVAW